jgi:nicotinate-nucleotide adenylyltransferase
MLESGPSFTADTLERLTRERPGDEFWFVVGGDSLRDLPNWRRPLDVIRLARIAVVDRPGSEYDLASLQQKLPGIRERVDLVDGPAIDISSTSLRAAVRSGNSIRFQTPEAVRAFINEKGLYR